MLRALLAVLLISSFALAQGEAKEAARAWVRVQGAEILGEFTDLLRIPNATGNADGLRANAARLRELFEKRNVSTKLLQLDGAPPVVYGERRAKNARQTVVFYAHYDGQPTDSKEWLDQGPWEPLLRSGTIEEKGRRLLFPAPGAQLDPEWRLYARSAADDKGAIMAMLAALDALDSAGLEPSVNLKFVLEGEEESGSAHLGRILAIDRDLVKADFWIICDGPVHQTRARQIYFGARGIATMDLTVYGPVRELHSGHYGNWAPNPAMRLAQLLASMKNEDGRVLIKGFYDGIAPLNAAERKALEEAPDVEPALMESLGIARPDNPGRRLSDTLTEPSLNISGLRSADTGAAARNVIPAEASTSLDLRLVKGEDWRALTEKVVTHIVGQGYTVLDREPTARDRIERARIAKVIVHGGYNAVRTPMELPASRQVMSALQNGNGALVKLPTLGGSVPLSAIEDAVHVPLIGVPIANHDSNQHSANENLRLKNLWDGIEIFAALFTMEAR